MCVCLSVCLFAIFTGTRSRTHSKQVPNERGTSQEGFKCNSEVLGPGGAALAGTDPPETGDRETSREIRRLGFDSLLRRLFIGLTIFPMGERGGREGYAGRGLTLSRHSTSRRVPGAVSLGYTARLSACQRQCRKEPYQQEAVRRLYPRALPGVVKELMVIFGISASRAFKRGATLWVYLDFEILMPSLMSIPIFTVIYVPITFFSPWVDFG